MTDYGEFQNSSKAGCLDVQPDRLLTAPNLLEDYHLI